MGEDTTTTYSYDDLGGNRFRVRLLGKKGSAEFKMPAGWRYAELRDRLETEAAKLVAAR